jgi:hypothetical protein
MWQPDFTRQPDTLTLSVAHLSDKHQFNQAFAPVTTAPLQDAHDALTARAPTVARGSAPFASRWLSVAHKPFNPFRRRGDY